MSNKKYRYIIGIDEVGRGPIAGPVAVGAFIFLDSKAKSYFNYVKESKQLTERKREGWFQKIEKIKKDGLRDPRERLIDFAVTFQSEKVIDKMGISFAIKKAIELSLAKLKVVKEESLILLDGGLKAPLEYINQKTIIKGDEKKQIIALASICAKVIRDRKMRELAKKYPEYGFEVNKGYGTRKHYEAIKKYGLSNIHRRSFCRAIKS